MAEPFFVRCNAPSPLRADLSDKGTFSWLSKMHSLWQMYQWCTRLQQHMSMQLLALGAAQRLYEIMPNVRNARILIH